MLIFFFERRRVCLKGGFPLVFLPQAHEGRFSPRDNFFFFTLGLPQGGFQPQKLVSGASQRFSTISLLFFLFSIFFKNKTMFKNFYEMEAETLPSTFTSLLMVLMNSSLDRGLLQDFNLYPLTIKGIPSTSIVLTCTTHCYDTSLSDMGPTTQSSIFL